MNRTVVYGASDDCVVARQLEGLAEEVRAKIDEPTFVQLSDGTVLRATYDTGGHWRMHTESRGEGSKTTLVTSPQDDLQEFRIPDYSEAMVVLSEEPVAWAERAPGAGGLPDWDHVFENLQDLRDSGFGIIGLSVSTGADGDEAGVEIQTKR